MQLSNAKSCRPASAGRVRAPGAPRPAHPHVRIARCRVVAASKQEDEVRPGRVGRRPGPGGEMRVPRASRCVGDAPQEAIRLAGRRGGRAGGPLRPRRGRDARRAAAARPPRAASPRRVPTALPPAARPAPRQDAPGSMTGKNIDAAGAGATMSSPGWLTQLNLLWSGKGVGPAGRRAAGGWGRVRRKGPAAAEEQAGCGDSSARLDAGVQQGRRPRPRRTDTRSNAGQNAPRALSHGPSTPPHAKTHNPPKPPEHPRRRRQA
jgi:hypothetical protein